MASHEEAKPLALIKKAGINALFLRENARQRCRGICILFRLSMLLEKYLCILLYAPTLSY
jgi:hypothetical protein